MRGAFKQVGLGQSTKVSLSFSHSTKDRTWGTTTQLHPQSWGSFTLVMARKLWVNSYGISFIHLIRIPSARMHGEKFCPNLESTLILAGEIPA